MRRKPEFYTLVVLAALGAGFLVIASPLARKSIALPSDGAARPRLCLARDGKAQVPVVISAKAAADTKEVAAELARYLGRITGGTFKVQTGDGSAGIVLGTLAEFPQPDLSEALAIRRGFDGKEAYAIRTEARRLLLLGATPLGASHAAYRFLETLGCRRFFPAPEWEVVPRRQELSAAVNETARPAFVERMLLASNEAMTDLGGGTVEGNTKKDFLAWRRQNRVASSLKTNSGHSWPVIVLANQAEFSRHPEYLTLVKGKRRTVEECVKAGYGFQLCVSNPQVRKLVTRWALEQFKQNAALDMVSLDPDDGMNQCECEACKRVGSVSDRVYGLVNETARAVAQAYPGKMVGLQAYVDRSEPPSFALEPNVYVQLTHGYNQGKHSFDDLLDLWPRRCHNLGVYEYYNVWIWCYDRPPLTYAAQIGAMQEYFRRYKAKNVTAVTGECGVNWGPYGRGYYIITRLLWDPNADVAALLQDFYEKAFGPAAKPMQRFYERLDPEKEPFVSRQLLGMAFRDLDEATRLAHDRPDIQARLGQLKLYMHYVHLRWQFDHEKDAGKKKALLPALLTHIYRLRNTYLIFSKGFLHYWTPNVAREFKEPQWRFALPGGSGPYVDKPFDRAEPEEFLRQGLAAFPAAPAVEPRTFSRDLVPVRLVKEPGAKTEQSYQMGVQYTFYSLKGEPLRLEVVVGNRDIIKTMKVADARYRVTSAAGATVAEGHLVQDAQRRRLEIKVPAAGLYYFDYESYAACWSVRLGEERPFQLVLPPRQVYHSGQMQPLYFYVPRGTKQIQYSLANQCPHQVLDPDGKVVRKIEELATVVTIPVPPGSDGKAWSFRQLALGGLRFANIPNYLAASPNALLVPREVAKKDGLTILAPK